MLRVLAFALPLCLVSSGGGWLAADDFPELFNTEPNLEVPMMPAGEAANAFRVPEGFTVSLFASEPEVQNPIDLAWDGRGRLWIAENYTYAERQQRFQLGLRDRVVVFQDSDGDGRQDKRTVFTDSVQMLTSVEVGRGGVWLMCPPKLLFIPDENHDAVPDGPAEVVLDGFDVAKANYHNFANGLRFGPDGWLYGRCGGSCPGRIGRPGTPDEQRVALEGGIWRYHPEREVVEVLTAGTTNPWGHDWNEVGQLFFINTVNGHFWHGIPGAHFTRPFTLDPNPHTYELIDFHADHWHFDTGKSWTASRDGAANDYGGGHAHCGLMIYQGDNWPQEYRGRAFTLNLHGRRVNQEILSRHGAGYVASHGQDLLVAGDPWFRGMELSGGPDGSVFVIDWSDTGECHEHTGVHRTSGRVFKVTYEPNRNGGADDEGSTGSSEDTAIDLYSLSADDLLALQQHPNRWFARQARLELAERASQKRLPTSLSTIQLFEQVDSDHDVVAVRSLLALNALGHASRGWLEELLTHRNEHVRVWAIRLLTEFWSLDDCYGPTFRPRTNAAEITAQSEALTPRLVSLAESDPSGLVRLTLASTLQRLPVQHRGRLAEALVARSEDAGDHNLPLLIWYGLMPVADERPSDLVAVAQKCELPATRRLIARRLAEEIEDRPLPLNRVLQVAAETRDIPMRVDILKGVTEAMKGWRSASEPAMWDRVVAASTSEPAATLVRDLSVVFGDGRSLEEVRQLVADASAEPGVRLSALKTLIQINPPDLREICEPLLKDARMNVLAAQGLSSIDDPQIGHTLVARYRNFRAPQRPKIISILSSRASFADALLSAIGDGKIPREDLSAFQVRQIQNLGPGLRRRVAEVWGEVRETTAEKREAIETLKAALRPEVLARADRVAGRALFLKNCQNCHRLYGEGGNVGPDLTGSNRSDLDYLLGNIVDPSSVVDKDYRMTILFSKDGRLLSGLVTDRTDRTLTLHTATESMTLDRQEILNEKVTEKSPMPEGLLDTLSDEQVRNLIGYLAHPSQVPLRDDNTPASVSSR